MARNYAQVKVALFHNTVFSRRENNGKVKIIIGFYYGLGKCNLINATKFCPPLEILGPKCKIPKNLFFFQL